MKKPENKWIVYGQDWSEWSDNPLLIDCCTKDTTVCGVVEHDGSTWLALTQEHESKKGLAVKLAHPEHPEGRPLKFALASEITWLERFPHVEGQLGGDGIRPRWPSMTFSKWHALADSKGGT